MPPVEAGAVYVTVLPVPVTVPTVLFPLATPSTIQVTPVFVLPETVAVKVEEAPVARVRAVGLSATLRAGGGACTVTVAVATLVVSAVLVAVRVWIPAVAGAV